MSNDHREKIGKLSYDKRAKQQRTGGIKTARAESKETKAAENGKDGGETVVEGREEERERKGSMQVEGGVGAMIARRVSESSRLRK